jgi:hypothetical protein
MGTGGLATDAKFYGVGGVAVDTSGNIYISDVENHQIRKVTASTGIINAASAATGSGCSTTSGQFSSTPLYYPGGLFLDNSGNLYVTETYCNTIWKVNISTGVATVIAGNGYTGFSGDGQAATQAKLYSPQDVAVDISGNVYIADYHNNRIRKVTASTGIISTVAGNGIAGYSGDGGSATSAEMNYPTGVGVDSSGNIYIVDHFNNRIRMVTGSTGVITTIVGTGVAGYSGDGGAATNAQISSPTAVRVDGAGNVFIADSGNQRIREVVAATGVISTVAGNGVGGFLGDGGAATGAELNLGPPNIAYSTIGLDNNTNLYICDGNNDRVRAVGH